MSRQPGDIYLISTGLIFLNYHVNQLKQGPNGVAALDNHIEGSAATLGSHFRLSSGLEVGTPAGQPSEADTDIIVPPRLHERGDSVPDFRSLPAGKDTFREDTFGTKPDSPVADSPADEDSDCLNMAPTQTDDVWQDSQGTIQFLSERVLKYNPISDPGLFFPGRVIQVSGQDADQSVSGCAMVVLAVSKHGFPQCLMLCQHHGQEGDEEEKSFWEAHSAVYPNTLKHVDRNKAYEDEKPNRPITIQINNSLVQVVELAEDCFINYQHTWSLRKDKVKIAPIGKVSGNDLMLLRNNYRETQKRMYSEK